ncbi:MAG: hypothetical protein IPQ21_17175 [Betaproteobacteria bacterium]|nr:hypothetical protein [Betaproteobacteria bacterium]
MAPLLRAALPPGAVLAIGNSSPVRDLDHDLPPDAQALTLLHQRGAAGIDGAVAGAAGARSVLDAPMALLLGDVALLHDAGGLAAAAAVRGPLAIVVWCTTTAGASSSACRWAVTSAWPEPVTGCSWCRTATASTAWPPPGG